jgi:hypothetical protein
MFRLNSVPEHVDGLRLVIMATGPQTVGTVTVSPQKEAYHTDERVELTATPAEGWRFAGWHSRYWSDNSRETDIDIYRDMTIEARFVEIEPDDD